MAKKQNIRLDRIFRKADVRKTYISDDTVFIDASIVRKVKRKALQMQGQLSLHFVGVHYQQCLEELGLWHVKKPETFDGRIYIDSEYVHQLRRKVLQKKKKWLSRSRGKHYQRCFEELGLWELRREEP